MVAPKNKGARQDEFLFSRTQKSFLFGGDATSVANWCIHLPVWIAGTKGRIQCFIVAGNTPLLVGRPVLTDYQADLVSVLGEEWTRAAHGPRGEYLIYLDDGLNNDTSDADYAFDYITDDKVEDFVQDMPLSDLSEDLADTGRYAPDLLLALTADDYDGLDHGVDETNLPDDPNDREKHLLPLVQGHVPVKLWKSLHHSIRASANYLDKMVEDAFRSQHRRPQFWEVYSGGGTLSSTMRDLGFDTKEFDLPDWNFEDPRHRSEFFAMLEADRPEVVWLAPPCTKWSPLQALNARTKEQVEWLQAERDYHYVTHIKFSGRVFRRVNDYDGLGIFEHPRGSKAWKTAALQNLPGEPAMIDQCALGCTLPNSDGQFLPVRKSTRLQITYGELAKQLGIYRCNRNHQHVMLMGSSPGIGSRASAAASYQEPMCRTLGCHIAEAVTCFSNKATDVAYPADDAPEADEDDFPNIADLFDPNIVFPEGPTTDVDAAEADHHDAGDTPAAPASSSTTTTGVLSKLQCQRASDANKIVARLHRNLNHPSKGDLRKILIEKGASETVVKAADDYNCPTCHRLSPPPQTSKSTLRSMYQFNERLLADTIWLQVQGRPIPVVTMLDAATRYMSTRVIRRETTEEFIQAIQRGWIKTFGPPLALHVDSHRAWGSDEFRDFVTTNDIALTISPGEAHNRLAQLERRHQVLRKAVEYYMADKNLDSMSGLAEALIYVVPQINATLGVGGFSPTQWVLGYQPRIPGSLLDDSLNYSHLAPSEAFQAKLASRTTAASSVLKADNDQRLRRALLRQHRGDPLPLHVGQRCFYWREAAGVGPRVRWKGPAVVVLVENDPQSRPSVYWLVHGSALLRAAPEHVRPDFEQETLAANTPALHDLLQTVQNRGTTTFSDLIRTTRKRPRAVAELLTDDEAVEADDVEVDVADSRSTWPLPPVAAPMAPVAPSPTAPPSPPAPLPDEPEPEVLSPSGLTAGPAASLPAAPGLPASSSTSSSAAAAPDLQREPSPALPYGETIPTTSTPIDIPVPADANDSDDLAIPIAPTMPTASMPAPPRDFSAAYRPLGDKATFAQRRLHLDRQETVGFRPSQPPLQRERSRSRHEDRETVDYAFSVDVLQPFRPDETGDCPLPLHFLSKDRTTVIGKHKHSDRWRRVNHNHSETYWTGRTIFKLNQKDRRDAEASFYQASEGQSTYAGTKTKRAKDAKSLDEKTLSLADRVTFMEAKRRELESFFTNNVWEFSHLDEAGS